MQQYIRPRRLRKDQSIRDLVSESLTSINDLIYPVFLLPGKNQKEPISSMPGQNRVTLDLLLNSLKDLTSKGLKAICLFPSVPGEHKDQTGSYSYNPDNFYLKAITEIKNKFPNLLIMTDVALDPYSTEGHDGIVDTSTGEILNDPTLAVLNKMSLAQAKAGADIIGPSDMMDGRVGTIRETLEGEGFHNTLIMSYTAKYASAFYGPFREALDSAPNGDKKTYQMDIRNSEEALREAELDLVEGADILMVKPGMAYLDIVKLLSSEVEVPISVYQVSGEYAMIKAVTEKGWLSEKEIVLESLVSFKRAGASMILTYFAPDLLDWLRE